MNARWERSLGGAAEVQAQAVRAALPRLETSRLTLRAPEPGDFDAYAEILTTGRGVHIGGPFSRKAAWLDFCSVVANWVLHGIGLWTIEMRDTGIIQGFVLICLEYGDPEPELGFLLLEEAEGKGIAREAAEAARDHALNTLGWDSIASFIAAGNTRSKQLVERMGAKLQTDGMLPGEPTLVYRHIKQEELA